MTDALIFIPFITFISELFIFAYVLGQRKKSIVNNSFLLFIFFMMLAPFVYFLIQLLIFNDFTVFLYQLLNPILLSLGFLFLNFVYTLVNRKRDKFYWWSFAGLLLSVIMLQVIPPFSMIRFPGYNIPLPVPTIWFMPPFFFTLVLVPAYAILLCLWRLKTENDIVLFRQLRLVILGSFISTPFTIVTVFVGPIIFHNYLYIHFATLGILINAIFMFRAVQRHFLLSVNIEQVENAFNRLFENSHDSVILMDGQGIAIQVNKSAKDLLNPDNQGITKEFLEQHISGYDFLKNGTDISATFKTGQDIKHLQVSQSLIKSNDISLGKLLIIRDITLQKKTEQVLLETKNIEAIGQLAGGIAHDFNNFLCGIVSNLSLAKMELDPLSKAAELLLLSEKTALHARDLTQQLLTFSKGDIRKNEVFDIVDLISEQCSFMSHGSSADISCDLPKTAVSVKADKGQMRQVFQNIILNAIESMPGSGAITIRGKTLVLSEENAPDRRAGTYFQVSISDQGTGIAPENLSRIFEPYYTTKPNGNGLGLAIVNSIITKNNGSISVDSELGKGSVFTVNVPVSASSVQPASHHEVTAKTRQGRILIMDDYPTVRLSLALLLQRMGYTVDQASSGNQALVLYDKMMQEKGSYLAVITDLTVPGAMGGKELAEELHKRNPDLSIIISSGYSEELEISRYKDFGFAGVLHKPYSHEELQEILGSVLLPA